MKKIVISDRESGQRIDKYMNKLLPGAGKGFFYKMFRKKNIVLNGKKISGDERIAAGDEVKLYLSDETFDKFRNGKAEGNKIPNNKAADNNVLQKQHNKNSSASKVSDAYDLVKGCIVYEDDEILVVNKPTGILSQKSKPDDISLVEMIEEYVKKENSTKVLETEGIVEPDVIYDTFKPGICNRLDRNTSGIVMAGKTIESLQHLNTLFRDRNLEKNYYCLVEGKLERQAALEGYMSKDEKRNTVRLSSSEGKKMITLVSPIAIGSYRDMRYTLVKVKLITGKTHQIRVHLKSIGHPIVGDHKYGSGKNDFGLRRHLLHAAYLKLPDGREFRADMPDEFKKCLDMCGIDFPEL